MVYTWNGRCNGKRWIRNLLYILIPVWSRKGWSLLSFRLLLSFSKIDFFHLGCKNVGERDCQSSRGEGGGKGRKKSLGSKNIHRFDRNLSFRGRWLIRKDFAAQQDDEARGWTEPACIDIPVSPLSLIHKYAAPRLLSQIYRRSKIFSSLSFTSSSIFLFLIIVKFQPGIKIDPFFGQLRNDWD